MLNTALKERNLWPKEKPDLFLEDALSLFSGKKSGHMNAYAFNEPNPAIPNDLVRGGEHWTNFIKNSWDYYLIPEESRLIEQSAKAIGSLLPAQATVVDLGPGEKRAVLAKTWPFIKGLQNPKQFIAVDVNGSFADNAAKAIMALAKIPSRAVISNFLEENLETNPPAVFSLFGGLLCNAARTQERSGFEELTDNLKRVSRHNMKSGDYLVITQDANQDEASLFKAYSHPDIAKYILSVLHKIKRDLPTEGFNPEQFEYVVQWNEEEHLLSLNARSTHDQNFTISGVGCSVLEGQEIPLVNSYKYPVDFFVKSAQVAGYTVVKTYAPNSGSVVLHVLQAQ